MLTVLITIVLWSGNVTYNYMPTCNIRRRVKVVTCLRGSIFYLYREEYNKSAYLTT